jgi:hypothetical protein
MVCSTPIHWPGQTPQRKPEQTPATSVNLTGTENRTASNRNSASTIATDWPCTHNSSPGVNHSFQPEPRHKVTCRQNLTRRIRRQLLATAMNPPQDRPPDQEPQTDSPHPASFRLVHQPANSNIHSPPSLTHSQTSRFKGPPIQSPSIDTTRDDHPRQKSSNPPPDRPRNHTDLNTAQTQAPSAYQQTHPGCLQ